VFELYFNMVDEDLWGGTTLMMSILGVVEQGLRILMVLGRKCRIRLINVRIWFAEVII